MALVTLEVIPTVSQLTDLMVNPFVGQMNTTNEYHGGEFICVSDFGSYEPYGETREIQWSEFQEMATKDVKS